MPRQWLIQGVAIALFVLAACSHSRGDEHAGRHLTQTTVPETGILLALPETDSRLRGSA